MPGPHSAETDAVLAQLEEPTRVILARLAKNTIPPDKDQLLLGDFVECTFAGYAPIRLTGWEGEEPWDDMAAEVFSQDCVWEAAAGVVPEIIGAVYVTVQEGAGPVQLVQAYPLQRALIISLEGQKFAKRFRVFSNNVLPPV